MTPPIIVPRADHILSRRDIDPDALKVLYRLNQAGYIAYLVGGSVRDLLLGRHPKDFDIGTDAHPYQIKKLFRNCWIIGRRFRLAHIKFGQKTIEVATFRRNVPDAPAEPAVDADAPEATVVASAPEPAADEHLIHRDNTFGTQEEDAFRRDFTINALFYDIATHSIIDYVGGLEDLKHRVIRSIGDPNVRFAEDPVRMLRAVVFAARLHCEIDQPILDAIASGRGLMAKASPARLIEEYYKILRSGSAEATFRALCDVRLIESMTPELRSPPPAVWDSLARLDHFRRRFPTAPPELTNAILIGALLVPLGVLKRVQAPADDRRQDRVSFGVLPVARRDLERLRHIMYLLPKFTDPNLSPRNQRGIPHRPAFADALTWLDIFGDVPDVVQRWRDVRVERPPAEPRHANHPPGDHRHATQTPGDPARAPGPRRRRRRRRGGRGRGGPVPPPAAAQ